MFEQILFYSFGGLLVLSALMVITVRNPVFAALFLVLSFFASAGIWLLLEAEFLAIALVLVYVGAVMVLFLFVIMMLDINLAPLREGFARFLPVAAIVAVLMMIAMGSVVSSFYFRAADEPVSSAAGESASNTSALGQAMYTDYLYPFEIAGAILLVAIIAAISLTMRKQKDTKSQQPGRQVTVRKEDRLRKVNLKNSKQGTGG
ncbi:MAG TPA: NADH-quinone oxidoreductase subunit J [Gammaproteobacteria bacterium]|nr:NADH-quinone oxidoreductase subunit J [Gammaproteobacteria bacterium]